MPVPLVDINDVAEVLISMGFTQHVVNRRLRRFERHPIYLHLEIARGVGVPLPVLEQDIAVHGLADDLRRALEAHGKLTIWQPAQPDADRSRTPDDE